jgi:hypothetical protein
MLEDNRYVEWHAEMCRHISIPSGIDHCEPKFVGDLVTEFLGLLQKMNKDAFGAGTKEAASRLAEPQP